MAERRRGKPAYQIKIAKERIDILFREAARTKHSDLKNRYVQLARRIGMRYNVKIPAAYKRRYCRYCYAYFSAAKRRLKKGMIMIECPGCGKINRYPYR